MASGLSLAGVSVRYGDTLAVDDVSLALPEGQTLAVLGPSGCGKSTLLRAVAGLEPLVAGTISYGGEQVQGLPTHRRGFAMMFQDGQLFGHQSVGANVGYALRIRRVPRADRVTRVGELLELVGLTGYAGRLPGTLSGGERQRVALARALAVDPRLILLDEPLSALDASLRGRLAADLRRILSTAGTTALLVTHDHEEAFALADRIAVMRAGRIVQQGAPAEVWAAPVDADTALFLGYARVLTGDAAAALLAAGGLDTARAGARGLDRRDARGLDHGDEGAPRSSSRDDAVALRRSALVIAPGGDGALAGVVRTAQATPEQWRLTVDVPLLGIVDAVARLDGGAAPTPGQRVSLSVDPARLAVVGVG